MLKKISYLLLTSLLCCTFAMTSCVNSSSHSNSSTSIETSDAQTRIVLKQQKLQLLQGDETALTARAYLNDKLVNNAELTWSSKNPAVATVKNGTVTAVGKGKTTISVTYGSSIVSLPVEVFVPIDAEQVNSFDEAYVNIYGRSYISNRALNFDHAANAIEVGIFGTTLSVNISSTAISYMRVFVDGQEEGERIQLFSGNNQYTIDSLSKGYHKIRLVKATEEQNACWDILSFESEIFTAVPEKSDLKIEFIGDSITAGYAVLGSAGESWSVHNSDATKTYTYLTAQALNANYSTVAWSGICTTAYHWCPNVNMETLYKRLSHSRLETYSFDFNPNVIVLNLGSNEASYLTTANGANYASKFPEDYRAFLNFLREKNPNAYIICLLGTGTNSVIEASISQVVENMNDEKIVYNPFRFIANGSGAAGHPTMAAQKEWAATLTAYIQQLPL